MGIFILWILGALIIAAVFGAARTIGFWGSFLVSIVFSPLIGLIVSLCYRSNEDEQARQKQLQLQQQQVNLLKSQKSNQDNLTEQLERLSKLKDEGHLTQEEYQQAKNKLLSFD